MNKHLDVHNKVLESSAKALEYAKKKARKLDTDIPEDNVLLLDKLEHKASEQNVLFCLYQQAKQQYRVRPTNNQLKDLANTGRISINGLDLAYSREDKKAFINGTPVYSEPLLDAGTRPTDASIINYSNQRRMYLTEVIVNQRSYITHDSKGHTDGYGNEINSHYDINKAKEALEALEPDPNNINPNGVFLTGLTAQQKIRTMLLNINESRDKVRSLFNKLTSDEVESINKPLQEEHRRRTAHEASTGKIGILEALNRPTTHVLDAEHEFVKNNLSDIDGLNDTKNFPLNYLKPIPKGYTTLKERLDTLLEAPYDLADDEMSSIAKQMVVFDNAKKALSNTAKNPLTFDGGVDDKRFYVTTTKISHGQLYEGQSATMDSDGRFKHVSSGEFGITKSGTLKKDLRDFDAVILTVGPKASGSFSKAIEEQPNKDKNVLVIDALEESNVTDVLNNIRGSYRIPVVVFTDNKQLHNYLEQKEDKNMTAYLSEDYKWGDLGLKFLKEESFDRFQKGVDGAVEYAIHQSQTTLDPDEKPLVASSNQDTLIDDVDKKSKIDNDNPSNETQQFTQTRNKGF